MRRGPVALATATLVGYGAAALLYVLGILLPTENPPGPTPLIHISPLSFIGGTCLFPLSIVSALLTGMVSLLVLRHAGRRGWSRLFGGMLLLIPLTAVLSLLAVQAGRAVPDGVVLALVGLGILSGASLLLLPVLSLVACRGLRVAAS